jgi:hypothetical protein
VATRCRRSTSPGLLSIDQSSGDRKEHRSHRHRDGLDAALILAEVVGYRSQNNYRIQWKTAMSNECPWYVWEVPTFMVSHNYTTHLHDASMPNDLVWNRTWQARL